MFNENETVDFDMETTSTSSIEQQPLQENRKRKLNDRMMKEAEQQVHYYQKLSDNEIKERLLKKIAPTSNDVYLSIRVHQWLEKHRILFQFIREHASLLTHYFSLKMELELGQSYIKMTEPILPWLSTLSKAQFMRNHVDHDRFFQIRKSITKQLKSSEEKFRIITESLAKSISYQQQASSSSSEVDIKTLTSLIIKLVQEDQQGLNIDFIKKRHLLMLHVKDVFLLHEFYYLQPNSEQLRTAEHIWATAINQQQTDKTVLNNELFDMQKQHLYPLRIENQEGDNVLPMHYGELNLDLLLNIIDSRRRILIQHLKFADDYKQLFRLDADHGNDDDNIGHDVLQNTDNNNKKRL